MDLLLSSFLFLLGLLIGSFLNVCIYRLPKEESVVMPPSHCSQCGHRLAAGDLVPVFSWAWLKGRCRYCGQPISVRYALVELLTACLFVWCYQRFGLTPELGAALVFSAFMVSITFIDLDHQIILDGMLILLAVSGLGMQLWTETVGVVPMMIGAGVGGGLLLLLAILSRGGMGGGDVKFAAALGFWLGWPEILLGLFIGFVSGGVISLVLLITGLRGRKDFIPFGPFIAIGAWVTFLYGKRILDWYLALLI